jgi:energy-coupling factor transporter ATP-binding protein EcfA2
VDRIVRSIFSKYRKRYLEHLVYRHRNFDVKGLTTQGIYTLELEQVFVELSVAPQVLHGISADPIRQVPEELRGGRHVIWDYLQAEQMGSQNLAIIGAPGCGKTTLLQHMTLTLAAGRKHSRQVNAPDKLPILLFLRNHAKDIQANPDLSLVQAAKNSLAKLTAKAPPNWFEAQLDKGHCLVMLDGLDEVADPETRKNVVKWVEDQMAAYDKNRFVITSRPHRYVTNPLSGVTVLEVRPFASDQVRRYVHNWYVANEVMSAQKDDPGVRMAAEEGAEDLVRRVRSTPALSGMAVNPLLLTMIATVHRYRSALPRRRVELYSEICDVFLGARQQAKGLELELTPAQKKFVLQPLAYQMMCQEGREITLDEAAEAVAEPLAQVIGQVSGEDFLKMIENTSGLLLERESALYGFAHKTFQEYLAATYVQESVLENDLVTRVDDSWWHETIRLYVAQTDATPVIAACLADDPPSVPALTLAIECIEEARGVQPEVRERLDTVLEQGVEDPDPERRQIVAEALLALRLRRMVRVDEDKYVDNSLITHAEYQLFLDKQRALGNYHQPDHWQGYQFATDQGRVPVVGVRPSDAVAFCERLTEREAGEWRYRPPMPGEVDRLPLNEVVQDGSEAGLGYWALSAEKAECVRVGVSRPVIPDEMLVHQIIHDASALASASASDLASTRGLARDLNRDRDRDLNRDRDRTAPPPEESANSLRQGIRVNIFGVAASWLLLAKRWKEHQPWTKRIRLDGSLSAAEEEIQRLADGYLSLYLDLAILEERILGSLPAFESIRIVKERKREETAEGA